MKDPPDVPTTERHRFVVDRFEGALAVVQVDGERVLDVPRWLLPPETGEGDVVEVTRIARGDAAGLELHVDREATARAAEDSGRLLDEARRKDPGGDIVL